MDQCEEERIFILYTVYKEKGPLVAHFELVLLKLHVWKTWPNKIPSYFKVLASMTPCTPFQ